MEPDPLRKPGIEACIDVYKSRRSVHAGASLACFREAGISESSIEFRRGNRTQALATYSADIDLALDTFPYNGGTTTCEALWMGVPSVAMYGSHPMSRLGCSLLVYSGLPALATTSPGEYVERAVTLANDRPLLRLRPANCANIWSTHLCLIPTCLSLGWKRPIRTRLSAGVNSEHELGIC